VEAVNDSRRKLLAILADPTITVIVVEHKDRLTRFGFRYIETLLQVQGRRVEVVNVSENAIEDLMADLVSIIYSFCSRLYGQRRAKRKTEKIVQELGNQKNNADGSHPETGEKEEVKETEKTEGALLECQAKRRLRPGYRTTSDRKHL
jgi:hypothetical protein